MNLYSAEKTLFLVRLFTLPWSKNLCHHLVSKYIYIYFIKLPTKCLRYLIPKGSMRHKIPHRYITTLFCFGDRRIIRSGVCCIHNKCVNKCCTSASTFTNSLSISLEESYLIYPMSYCNSNTTRLDKILKVEIGYNRYDNEDEER